MIVAAPPSRAEVKAAALEALGTVMDPELQQPVTTLGFVSACTATDEGEVHVALRLPTYFCAPNFAFLMVADAHEAVSAVPGVRHVEVVLEDHFASTPINAGVAARSGFVGSFEGLAENELDDLRVSFVRKAVLAGTDLVVRPLVDAGHTPAELVSLRLGDVPASDDLDRLRERRVELGLPAGDDAPLLVDVETGQPLAVDGVPLHLRKARLTQVGVEANTSMCSGMLRHRYPTPTAHDTEGAQDR